MESLVNLRRCMDRDGHVVVLRVVYVNPLDKLALLLFVLLLYLLLGAG